MNTSLMFHQQIGVQIFKVFVTESEFHELQQAASKFQRPSQRPSTVTRNSKVWLLLHSLIHAVINCIRNVISQSVNTNININMYKCI
jgi:hypothetical protein